MKILYRIFLSGGITSLVISFFSYQSTLDVHLHDTYYAIALKYVCWCFALIQFVFALLYKSLYKFFFLRMIGWLHTPVTVLVLQTVILFAYFTDSRPRNYLNWDSFKTFQVKTNIETTIIIIFILAQGLFLANLVFGYLKRRRRQNSAY